jgi:hypothetical protein
VRGCGSREVEEGTRVWEKVVARVFGIDTGFEGVTYEGYR